MGSTYPPLDIWYMCEQSLCNFDCAYCCSAAFRTTKSVWVSDESAQKFAQILEWIAALPYSIAARVATLGEPFISEELRTKKYGPCALSEGCRCKEDFSHLELAAPHPPRERSLGYWARPGGAEPEQPLDPALLKRLERAKGLEAAQGAED
jgi:hypothetical protein